MAETKVDIDVLYAALNEKRQANELSWREVAELLDISPSTFSRMAKGKRPDVDTFAGLLRWLAMSAEHFTTPPPDVQAEADPLAVISTHLRASRQVPEEDVEAFQDLVRAAYRLMIEKKKV